MMQKGLLHYLHYIFYIPQTWLMNNNRGQKLGHPCGNIIVHVRNLS